MEDVSRASRIFRFGPFEVDVRAGELRRSGLRIRLQEQPFQVLAMLLAHPGDVVTRDEIRQALWPADTFVDFNHGLNSAINRLREALGDSADHPRYVETLSRRGYRFIAPVADVSSEWSRGARGQPVPENHDPVVESARESVDLLQVPSIAPSAGRVRRRMLAMGALVLAAFAGLTLRPKLVEWQQTLLGHSGVHIQSVVVLPFENLTGDPGQEYFADGMTDALITELAQIKALRVISRISAMQYKGTKKLLPQVAAELDVDAVVAGTVRRSGDRVWMTVQLIDARADRHLWARPYERELRDMPALQGEMARDMVREMHIDVTPQERIRLTATRSVNPAAYDDYLRARSMRNGNKNDTQTAMGLLQHAVAIDSQFGLAYAELAHTYATEATLLAPQEKQWKEQALLAADKALALEPELAEAHLAKARVLGIDTDVMLDQTRQLIRRALALNPNLDEAHHMLGTSYNHLGLLDKASVELQKAIAINPANTGARFRIGINLLFQGKYAQAMTVFDGTRHYSPSLWGFYTAWALFHLGRRDEAAAVVKQSLQDVPQDEGGLLTSIEAMLAATAGDERRAEERITRAVELGKGFTDFHHTAYTIGSAYALMNKPEPALKWLQMAADHGLPCYPLFEKDSSLDHLRGDPGFMEFMAKLEKQWEHYKATL
jgi:TolB-like protein/DNA-binding winged helix-turn-helix (wHTH) protein/tetratricopeptide (TPR) repeat protein